MLYTKGSIVGFTSDNPKAEVVTIKFDALLDDKTIETVLDTLRGRFNDWGEALHFKITLESEDV